MKRFTKQACRENVVASFFPLKIYIYIYIICIYESASRFSRGTVLNTLKQSGINIKKNKQTNKKNPWRMKRFTKQACGEMKLPPFFPLIIFILLCFNVLSTVPRENRLADFLYVYIYVCTYVLCLPWDSSPEPLFLTLLATEGE